MICQIKDGHDAARVLETNIGRMVEKPFSYSTTKNESKKSL